MNAAPHPATVAAALRSFFADNGEECLALDDMAVKFGCDERAAWAAASSLCRDGRLIQVHDADIGRLVYRRADAPRVETTYEPQRAPVPCPSWSDWLADLKPGHYGLCRLQQLKSVRDAIVRVHERTGKRFTTEKSGLDIIVTRLE